MLKGTVKFFNETKGFGFIVDSASGEDIFVHVSGLVDKIREGDTVTFETQRGKKGMNAVNVQLASLLIPHPERIFSSMSAGWLTKSAKATPSRLKHNAAKKA